MVTVSTQYARIFQYAKWDGSNVQLTALHCISVLFILIVLSSLFLLLFIVFVIVNCFCYCLCSCYCSLFWSLWSLFLLLFICYPNWAFSVLFLSCKANDRVKFARRGTAGSYIFSFKCIIFLSLYYVYCLCVNVWCTAATGCQPNCG
jgi:hypothetical protein